MVQPETVDWQNQSFGDSDDHKIFESKRLIDVNPEGSDNDNDAGNFSFCESDKKSIPRISNTQDILASNVILQPNFSEEDLNLFAAPIPEDRANIEKALRRPTAVFVPNYADAGNIRSNTKVCS